MPPGGGRGQQRITGRLDLCDLVGEQFGGQVGLALRQALRAQQQPLHPVRELAALGVNRELQVAQLMRMAELAGLSRRLELRAEAVADPHFGPRVAHEVGDHPSAAARCDQVKARLRRLEHPLPLVAPVHPGAGFIGADDGACAHLPADRRGLWLQPYSGAGDDVGEGALAEREPEQPAKQAHQALVGDVLHVVEVANEGFETGAEDALRLQARGVLSSLRAAAVWAGASVAPGLDDDGLHRRDLDHLACAEQPPSDLRQVGAAVVARGGAALDDDVRGLPCATRAGVPGLGATLRVRLAVGTVGLAGLGGGSRGVRGVLRRLGEAVDELLQLSDPRLQLLDEGLLPEDDLDQFALGELLQLLACHGGDPLV